MPFASLGLAPEYVRVVADEGYVDPTPVQSQAIPLVLAGRDLLAGAQTGTGKTAAFVLPLLQRLHATPPPSAPTGPGQSGRRPIRALILTPTRELALQVESSVRTYGRHRPIRSVAIYGGVGFDAQVRALRAGPGIVVATPGRLLDHVGQRTIDLSTVEVLVLDEADRMLDMGFIRDIRRVIGLLPPRRQNLLFSATFSDEIRTLAEGLLDRPATVDVAPRNTAAELVEQLVVRVDRHRKTELLSHLVRTGRVGQALVFTRTKHGANRLADQLAADGIRATAIHGNKSQAQRVRALEDFKGGRVDLLVATDIASRGIDIESLPFVVNFELPMVASDYVHRIGRTGRAGVGGQAVSLVCVDEAGLLREIELLLRRNLPTETVTGFEPDRSLRPEPIRLRSGQVRPVQARPAQGRPGQARPAQGRPGQGRPGHAAPRQGGQPARPQARPSSRPFDGRPTRRPAVAHGAPAQRGAPAHHGAPLLHDARLHHGGPERHGGQIAQSGDRQRTVVALPGERLSRNASVPPERWVSGARTNIDSGRIGR